MEVILEQVTGFATIAHGTQRRKFTDEVYINHPVRVMNICREYDQPVEVLVAAILHDVLEDTATTPEEMFQFLLPLLGDQASGAALHLVIELTDVYTKIKYPAWNRRKRLAMEAERISQASAAAQTIKYADIIDNSLDIHHSQDDFAAKFLLECRALLNVLTRGDNKLRQRAVETVDLCIQKQDDLQRNS
ncbi:MAG: HD domain-containing protein [Chitinophagaceae bacterium]|nr:MAG: HD domain-containing protein [Chitinophagaceae bacterium]